MLLSSDSPSLATRGTQRSNISLSKVEPLIDNEFRLELISNLGSAEGSRTVSPTPPLGEKIQPFKPVDNGLLNHSYVFSGIENVNTAGSDSLSALHRAIRVDDVAAVVSLLDNGADINLSDSSGFTPLHAAVRYVELVNLDADPRKEITVCR